MNAPDLFSFEPTIRTFSVVEVEGTSEATRATMPALFPARKRSARSAPAPLFTPAE